MKRSHLALLLLLNSGWAAVPTVVTRLEHALSAAEFVFLRYALALGGILILWPLLPGRLPRGADFWRTVAMGIVVFNVGHLLQIGGIQLGSASDASILLALDPLVSSLGAAMFLHERIPGRRWAGFGIAMGGVAAMSLWRPVAPLPGLGANLLILLSFASEAVWSVMGKPLTRSWGIPKVVGLALGAGSTANLCLLLPGGRSHLEAFRALSWETWVCLAFLGVVLTSIGYSIWHVVIRDVPVSVAAMTIYLQPILGTGLAVALAGEHLHPGHVLGAVMILAGLVLGLSTPPARSPRRDLPVPER